MSTKHAHCVWYSNAKPSSAQGLIYEEHTGRNVAVTYDPKDAHLIAAAPDLLAALRRALEVIEGEYPADDEIAAPVIAQCREAIAKAEGRT